MQLKFWFFPVVLMAVISGCADFSGQPPAPVYGGYPNPDRYPYPTNPNYPPPAPKQPEIITTRPLEGMNRVPDMVEIQPNFPPMEQIPSQPQPEVQLDNSQSTDDPFANQQPEPSQPDTTIEQAAPEAAPVAPTAPASVPASEAFAPLEQFPQQTPAVNALVMAASDSSQAGQTDAAVASIERAIRIEPRNASLYYKLAVLRLDQSKPRLAEDIAKKASLLAAGDSNLKKHSWLLIAKARDQQGNATGADKARAEAQKY